MEEEALALKENHNKQPPSQSEPDGQQAQKNDDSSLTTNTSKEPDIASFPICGEDTGRLEDTAEPLPYTDHVKANSLSASATFIKPIAFDISLSSSQERIIKKKKDKSKALKKTN